MLHHCRHARAFFAAILRKKLLHTKAFYFTTEIKKAGRKQLPVDGYVGHRLN